MGPTRFFPAILLLLLQGLIFIRAQEPSLNEPNILEGSSPEELKQNFEKLIAEKFNITSEADPSSNGGDPSDDNSQPQPCAEESCGSCGQLLLEQSPGEKGEGDAGAPGAGPGSQESGAGLPSYFSHAEANSEVSEPSFSVAPQEASSQDSLGASANAPDAGSNASDASSNAPDAGSNAPDAGSSPPDADSSAQDAGSSASDTGSSAPAASPFLNVCSFQDDSHPEPFPSCSADYQLPSQAENPNVGATCQDQESETSQGLSSNPSELNAQREGQDFQCWSPKNLAESNNLIRESDEVNCRFPRSSICLSNIPVHGSSSIPVVSKYSVGRSYPYASSIPCSNPAVNQVSYSSQIGSCPNQYIQNSLPRCVPQYSSPTIPHYIQTSSSRISPQIPSPSAIHCITHRVERVVKPVIDECITTVPVVKKVLKNHVVETKRFVSVPQRLVLPQHEKYIRHVPVEHKCTRTVVDYLTRHVPVVKERNRTIEETYTEHVPVTENVTRTVIETIIKNVPVVVSRLRPVVHQKIRHVPIVETRFRPVVQETVTIVPVRQRIFKNLVECRIKPTRSTYIPLVPAVPVLLKSSPINCPISSTPCITPCSSGCHIK